MLVLLNLQQKSVQVPITTKLLQLTIIVINNNY